MQTLRLILTVALFSALSAGASDNGVAGLSSLPVAAQANISAALGRDGFEYYAHPVSGGFEAHSGGLASRFTRAAVEVNSGSARWGLALRAYGYGDALKTVHAIEPLADKNRVEYRRGALTEWYVNGPMGLEQGFTIRERPGGKADGLLTIALQTWGELKAVEDASGGGLKLADRDGGGLLRYTGLSAFDADQQDLHASLRVQGQRLLLEVDDSHARYPIVVDPVVQLAKLTASDGSLGLTISISGDVIVAGTETNAAYVFVKPPTGWKDMTQTAKLTSSDGTAQDLFGIRVAISGNVIVVGAPGANENRGAAYVFTRPPNGWKDMTETAKLVASDGVPGDTFGIVGINGGTVVVGALNATVNGNQFQGAAYVFVRPMGGWANSNRVILTESAKLNASDGKADSFFGSAVSVAGEAVVVGAPFANGGTGAAYVFVKPPSGWVDMTETAELSPSDFGGGVGTSVATNGDVVVAGALEAGTGGSAYVFIKPKNGWADITEVAQLLPTKIGWSFGISVATDGTGHVIAVGAYQGNGHENGAGDVFVFVEPPSGWQTTKQYKYRVFASDGKFGDGFGYATSFSKGAMAVVDAGGGSAYVFAKQ